MRPHGPDNSIIENSRERIEADLAARVNPELSRRFASEQFQLNHDALMELGLHPGLVPSRPTISVVGSNGKGSVAWYLAALLGAESSTSGRQSGQPVGLYTSPHLSSFNERIRVNLEPADFDELETCLNEVREIAETGERRWTYFEILTLTALRCFQLRECRALVFEAGLGGRLDATRMIRPDLVVLTIIEAEHTAVLGKAPEKILREKLGIITPETKYVVAMPQPHLSEKDIREVAREFNPNAQVFIHEAPMTNYLEYNLGFARFCLKTMGLKAMGLETSGDTSFPGAKIPNPPGRLQERTLSLPGKSPRILFDTAHNAPAFRETLRTLKSANAFPGPKRCLIIYGMLPDRNPGECIELAEEAGFEHIVGIRADFLHEPAGPSRRVDEIPELIREGKFDLIIMLGSHRIYKFFLDIIAACRI